MKKHSKRNLVRVLCVVIVMAAGCAPGTGKNPEPEHVFTFVAQDVQPIEAHPFVLPKEISSQSGLHRLDVQRPEMDAVHDSEDVINAILGSAELVATLTSNDLLSNSYLESGDQQMTKTMSSDEDYLELFFQLENTEQDDGTPQQFREISGGIALDGLDPYLDSTGGWADSSKSAILYKHRFSGEMRGFVTGFYNGSTFIHTGISTDFHLFFWADQNSVGYSADSKGEYTNSLEFIENEWYFTLAAGDGDFGYRYITWQENDPSNHAFYACDLSAIYKPYDFPQQQDIRTRINFFTQTNEIDVDIASLSVYAFENFKDLPYIDESGSGQNFMFANDDEKFQLGVQLFESEDYYSAYTIFSELDGYDSSGYLAECERLLATVEIDNWHVAEKIRKAMKERGMPIYAYLYTYQAEKLESLDLSASLIDDLGFITHFPNLKELNLEANAIYDLSPLADLDALEILSLEKNHISDIRPLNDLQNLQYLDLNNNLLEDVSHLNHLSSLKALNLSTNNITNIDGLDSLPNLESVDLSYTFISSVSALENSPIKTLNIMNTDINDLGEVANFTELETLYAGFRYIWKGNDRYLLTERYEYDNHFFDGLSGLEALGGHESLRKLYLARLNVESLEPLTTIPNLERLIFHQYSGASHPGVLGKLVNLKELVLDSFGIGFYDTSFLSSLTQLEKLSIGTFCSVDDLSVISGLTHLKELRMHQYGDDLSFLSKLKNLKLLQLIHWEDVNDYSPLLALDHLEYLDLQAMAVYDLSIISQIENLKYLRIDSALINNIKDIGRLKNLEYFSMRWPQIAGEYRAESFDHSLFAGLDNLRFAAMDAGAAQGLAYKIGDPEYVEIIEEAVETGVELPDYDYFWIGNMEEAHRLDAYEGGQHLVISGLTIPEYQTLKISIPKYVRSLYISSDVAHPVKLALNCDQNVGLERIAIGNTYVSDDYPEGFGRGSFIIENLDGLAGCTNLKEIYTHSTQINDTSGLEGCAKLEVIELH